MLCFFGVHIPLCFPSMCWYNFILFLLLLLLFVMMTVVVVLFLFSIIFYPEHTLRGFKITKFRSFNSHFSFRKPWTWFTYFSHFIILLKFPFYLKNEKQREEKKSSNKMKTKSAPKNNSYKNNIQRTERIYWTHNYALMGLNENHHCHYRRSYMHLV